MDKNIVYTTPSQQLELLKKKNLIINDEISALNKIERYGFYNIINSYKEPYTETKNGKRIYKTGITFEQIFSLFTLDHNLRNSIMAAMLDLEEHLRAVTADVIAESFGIDNNEYLKWNHYRDRKVTRDRFSLKGILSTLQQNVYSDKDPIKYYREKYGIVPPWILFKGTYFSTLINYIRLFKNKEKSVLISKLYGISQEKITSDIKQLFSDSLFIFLDYRNTAAHGGRIYNFMSKHSKSISFVPEFLNLSDSMFHLKTSYGLSQLLILMDVFAYQQPGNIIKDSLQTEINRHVKLYSDDISYIESAINISIKMTNCVWITKNSKKFHTIPTCSGIINPQLMEIERLKANGYIPCKRCGRQFWT